MIKQSTNNNLSKRKGDYFVTNDTINKLQV